MASTWGMQCVGTDRPQADLYQVTEIAGETLTDILAFTMPPNSIAVLSYKIVAVSSSTSYSSYVGVHTVFERVGAGTPSDLTSGAMWAAVENAGLSTFVYPSGGDVVLRFTPAAAAVATVNNVRVVAHGTLMIVERPAADPA